jgi:hypothetical protein
MKMTNPGRVKKEMVLCGNNRSKRNFVTSYEPMTVKLPPKLLYIERVSSVKGLSGRTLDPFSVSSELAIESDVGIS